MNAADACDAQPINIYHPGMAKIINIRSDLEVTNEKSSCVSGQREDEGDRANRLRLVHIPIPHKAAHRGSWKPHDFLQ